MTESDECVFVNWFLIADTLNPRGFPVIWLDLGIRLPPPHPSTATPCPRKLRARSQTERDHAWLMKNTHMEILLGFSIRGNFMLSDYASHITDIICSVSHEVEYCQRLLVAAGNRRSRIHKSKTLKIHNYFPYHTFSVN